LQTALAKKDKCSLLNLWLCRFNLHCFSGRRVIGNVVRATKKAINMFKKFLYITFIITSIINYLSCDSNPLAPEYYDDGSFYYYFDEKIKIYPSNSVMLLKFKDNISPVVAKKILNDYDLVFYSKLYSDDVNIDTLINNNERIVIRLNNGRNTIDNIITRYPKVNYSAPRFGNLPEVELCLKSYSTDGSDKDSKRIFINGEIVFKVINDTISVDSLLKRYSLRLSPIEHLGENVYSCDLTEYSPKDPLKIANELHVDSNVLWATPNFSFFFYP
jgi:hypothetical protein